MFQVNGFQSSLVCMSLQGSFLLSCAVSVHLGAAVWGARLPLDHEEVAEAEGIVVGTGTFRPFQCG